MMLSSASGQLFLNSVPIAGTALPALPMVSCSSVRPGQMGQGPRFLLLGLYC